ncbi:hypothetical protein ACHAXA_003351 [Cyclostephanos tholiformis]|uniref:Uncharacterized protein n=1 Tax=Cyclostephanos tholiformis TaxID=382380 RepID=A0ABD3RGK5_9STRA
MSSAINAVIAILEKYPEEPLPAALVAVGIAVVSKFAIGFLCALYRYLLRPSLDLTKFGKYAVVTGATDGIGRAYAVALSKRGMSLILISRTEARLKAVADEIDSSSAKTRYIVCDYSNFDGAARRRVMEGLDGLDIGILINNVGVSYRYPMYYHELSDTEVGDIVGMNVNSTVHMTKMIIDGMASRRRGTIVNVSSGSAGHTMPLLAEYGAAKMFVERFSSSLDAEYRGRGVRVQCQIPFYVATKLAKLRKSLTVPTADEYARMGVRWLGYGGVVQPYWLHGFQGWVMSCLPSFILERGVMSMHDGIRRRGIKKDAKLAAGGGKKAE